MEMVTSIVAKARYAIDRRAGCPRIRHISHFVYICKPPIYGLSAKKVYSSCCCSSTSRHADSYEPSCHVRYLYVRSMPGVHMSESRRAYERIARHTYVLILMDVYVKRTDMLIAGCMHTHAHAHRRTSTRSKTHAGSHEHKS